MRFDTMCNCIDENWKALKARIQASITGIKLNGTTYYQTDGTGICDLGTIETEPPTASEVLMDDGTSVQDAIDNHTAEIDNLDDGLADSVKNVEIVEVTNGLNIQTTKNGGSIEQAGLISAGANMTMTGKTIDISDALKNTIIGAVETAESASTKADDAQTDATEALTKANAAITGIGTAVVDTALEMNIDKNDGSTATEPLFTAGTGLTWNENAIDSVAYPKQVGPSEIYNNTHGDDLLYVVASRLTFTPKVPKNLTITTGAYGASITSATGSTDSTGSVTIKTLTYIGRLASTTGTLYSQFDSIASGLMISGSTTADMSITVDEGEAFTATVKLTMRKVAHFTNERAKVVANASYGSGYSFTAQICYEWLIEYEGITYIAPMLQYIYFGGAPSILY